VQARFFFIKKENPHAGRAAHRLVPPNNVEAHSHGRAIVIGPGRGGHPVEVRAYADFAACPAQIDYQVGARGVALRGVGHAQRVEVFGYQFAPGSVGLAIQQLHDFQELHKKQWVGVYLFFRRADFARRM